MSRWNISKIVSSLCSHPVFAPLPQHKQKLTLEIDKSNIEERLRGIRRSLCVVLPPRSVSIHRVANSTSSSFLCQFQGEIKSGSSFHLWPFSCLPVLRHLHHLIYISLWELDLLSQTVWIKFMLQRTQLLNLKKKRKYWDFFCHINLYIYGKNKYILRHFISVWLIGLLGTDFINIKPGKDFNANYPSIHPLPSVACSILPMGHAQNTSAGSSRDQSSSKSLSNPTPSPTILFLANTQNY